MYSSTYTYPGAPDTISLWSTKSCIRTGRYYCLNTRKYYFYNVSYKCILSDYSPIFDIDCLDRLSIPEVMSAGTLCIGALVRMPQLRVSRQSEFGGWLTEFF